MARTSLAIGQTSLDSPNALNPGSVDEKGLRSVDPVDESLPKLILYNI